MVLLCRPIPLVLQRWRWLAEVRIQSMWQTTTIMPFIRSILKIVSRLQWVFVLSFILFTGIIFPMTFKTSFIKSTALFTGLLYLSGMVIYPLIPKAHALFWEDDSPDNDPDEVKQRPDHFSLFDWIGDAQNDSRKRDYRNLDHPDKGPGVN